MDFADRNSYSHISFSCKTAPALVGNVVVWKPSPAATYANYITHQILLEAGIPPGVIQFTPGPPPEVVAQCINNPNFAALHFTGSTFVFRKLWKDIASNLDKYKGYPRIVGETGESPARIRICDNVKLRCLVVGRWKELPSYSLIGGGQERCPPDRSWCFRVSRFVVKNTHSLPHFISDHFLSIGQKCSALSRVYVASSVWTSGFKDQLLEQVAKIKVGAPTDFSNFMGPVMYVAS